MTLAAVNRNRNRQMSEAGTAIASIVEAEAHVSDRHVLTSQLIALYQLGRQHANETLAVRLDIPANVPSCVVVWPGEGCPDPIQPHAHVTFSLDAPHMDTAGETGGG